MYKLKLGDRVNLVRERRQNEEIARSHARIGELERVVGFLIAKLLRKEPVSLAEEPVRRFLRLPSDATDHPEKYIQQALAALEPVGTLQCADCGSQVEDIPGYLEEKCPVCGAQIGSKR